MNAYFNENDIKMNIALFYNVMYVLLQCLSSGSRVWSVFDSDCIKLLYSNDHFSLLCFSCIFISTGLCIYATYFRLIDKWELKTF